MQSIRTMMALLRFPSTQLAVVVFTCAFLATQTYIVLVLGSETGGKLLQLQTVCLSHPSPASTGMAAREILQTWTDEDVDRVRDHFVVDFWIHPVAYAGALISAGLYEIQNKRLSGKYSSSFAIALPVLGALLDVLENYFHSSAIQSEPLVDVSDTCLWYGCVFASTKWLILGYALTRVLRMVFVASPVDAKTDWQ